MSTFSQELSLIEEGARVAGEQYAESVLDPVTLLSLRARGNQFGIAGLFHTEDIGR